VTQQTVGHSSCHVQGPRLVSGETLPCLAQLHGTASLLKCGLPLCLPRHLQRLKTQVISLAASASEDSCQIGALHIHSFGHSWLQQYNRQKRREIECVLFKSRSL